MDFTFQNIYLWMGNKITSINVLLGSFSVFHYKLLMRYLNNLDNVGLKDKLEIIEKIWDKINTTKFWDEIDHHCNFIHIDFQVAYVWFDFQDAEVPWHLIAIAILFTLIKLPGPSYPYWGRIFIPHFANGVLLRTLWFAILWHRRPQKASKLSHSVDGNHRVL